MEKNHNKTKRKKVIKMTKSNKSNKEKPIQKKERECNQSDKGKE